MRLADGRSLLRRCLKRRHARPDGKDACDDKESLHENLLLACKPVSLLAYFLVAVIADGVSVG